MKNSSDAVVIFIDFYVLYFCTLYAFVLYTLFLHVFIYNFLRILNFVHVIPYIFTTFLQIDMSESSSIADSDPPEFAVPEIPKEEPEKSISPKCSPQKSPKKKEKSESRERYHRESAEAAKKKIRLDFNPSESPDKNGASSAETENLCEQSECSSPFYCCLELLPNCYMKVKPEIEGDYFHVTKGEHICPVCYDNLIRM